MKIALEYTIGTELSQSNLESLPEYLKRFYILNNDKYRTFENVQIAIEKGMNNLAYRIVVPKTNRYVNIEVKTAVPVTITLNPSDASMAESFLRLIKGFSGA